MALVDIVSVWDTRLWFLFGFGLRRKECLDVQSPMPPIVTRGFLRIK